jgi:ABC-2 type transport system permease protein/ribosome-dependent ATPase
MNLRRVLAVANKEWREIRRDHVYMLLAFLMPAMLMLVFGYGMSQDIENVSLAIVDEDRTAASRDYAHHYIESRHFAFRGYLHSTKEADAQLADGRIKVVLVIPEHFAERLNEGQPASVQTLIDGSFTTVARVVRSYVGAINQAADAALKVRYLGIRLGVSPARAAAIVQPVRLEVRYLYNQEARSIWAVAPSLIMFTLTLVAPLLTALSVVREKESGAIYNVYASTITRGEFLAGKLLPSVGVTAANACVLWLLATFYFGAPFKGSLPFFAFATLLFVVCACGFGLIVSFLVRTQQAALIVASILAVLLAMQFSGMMTPASSMTGASRVIAHLFPPLYYQNVIKGTFMKGIGFELLWPEILFFIGFAVLLIAIAYALFRKRVRA